MEFKNQVARNGVAHVLHAVQFARRVIDDAERFNFLPQTFNLTRQNNDSDIVCVRMRRITRARLEIRYVRVQLSRGEQSDFRIAAAVRNHLRTAWRACPIKMIEGGAKNVLGLFGRRPPLEHQVSDR